MMVTAVTGAAVLALVIKGLSGAVVSLNAPRFSNGTIVAYVTSTEIPEASGLCASRSHENVLYTHNDSGDTPRVFAISATTGAVLCIISIDGAFAQDWEDIACGPCYGGDDHCIYIADTGGNAGGISNTIYRIKEPSTIRDQNVSLDGVLRFSYDQEDCESVMVDKEGQVYVVSKVKAGNRPKLVLLPSSAWNTDQRVQVNEGLFLPIITNRDDPVAGDISLDGKEVLIKTYNNVYYWQAPDDNYTLHLQEQPLQLPYILEHQGEAVCFDARGSGYYTLGEGINPPLYYYQRTSGQSGFALLHWDILLIIMVPHFGAVMWI